jgi:hypothetical protein
MVRQSTLPGVPGESKTLGGPIYQGVCKQIRQLEKRQEDESAEAWKARKDGQAGFVAAARSLAGSIDRVSGHTPGSRQASGVQLAAMHERLESLLERLDPTGETMDEFDRLLARMDQETNGGTKTPHAQV